MSIDALAKKIADGDEKAFESVYNQLSRLVFSICYGIVKSDSIASELTQDTFVSVWTYSHAFKCGSYKSWILTIAKNKSLNYLEKAKREISVDFSEKSDTVSIIDGEAIENSQNELDAETKITLKMALDRLEYSEREIVLLRNSGMKMKDVAKYLNIPRGTASWKYKEALKKLKKYMEGGR